MNVIYTASKKQMILLRFDYDVKVIMHVKDAIYEGQRKTCQQGQGGWSNDLKRWYIKPPIWNHVENYLKERGYIFLEDTNKKRIK